jgi:hypothetical protein
MCTASRQSISTACYSHVENLKEYFQLRAAGRGFEGLRFPSSAFAEASLQVYQDLDSMCRSTLLDILKHLNIPQGEMDKMLDPLALTDQDALKVDFTEDSTVCNLVPDGYVSSSNLDLFHYFNSPETVQQWQMNHYSHVDSGILSLIPCSDEPALDFFDQKLNCWIPLERVLHEQAPSGKYHRYGIYMTAESLEKSSNGGIKSGLHRVTRGDQPRNSVVFKQRGRPSCSPIDIIFALSVPHTFFAMQISAQDMKSITKFLVSCSVLPMPLRCEFSHEIAFLNIIFVTFDSDIQAEALGESK